MTESEKALGVLPDRDILNWFKNDSFYWVRDREILRRAGINGDTLDRDERADAILKAVETIESRL